ncbi:MAG: PLP-dependent aminotransferase family protein [Candidatus Viridilinea halotolerans]|uniref:PLP-dependent aminotransferase family protein n=1 Tax=Candidatus Viridilinea halotolerans TaxID=2491704 RepID=A0A426TT44_9CHLR|nr:MAG: PLP-dependent aminotransferase family protein [Candidatus Viridilinea halotolerans]
MQLADLFTPQARELAAPIWAAPPQAGAIPLISLAYGLADPVMLPQEELVEAAAQITANDVNEVLNYAPDARRLKTLIAERLCQEGVAANERQILVAYGSSQILGLLPHVLINPGDTVLVEAPTFMGAVRMFGRAGARLVGVPVDAEGLDVAALDAILHDLRAAGVRPRFLYSIPTFQNPSGATLSLARRQRVVALAAAYGVLVVEDDAYVDLRFRGEPLPPMAAMDTDGWVLRVGTFSKILAPGLRVGWAHGPKALIDRLFMFKPEGTSGPFVTHLVAQYCADGRLEAHIAALRFHYAAKCALMANALRRELPEATFVMPDGGFFIWLRLPEGVKSSALYPVAIEHGIEFLPGNRCFSDGRGDEHIRLAFSETPAAQIEEAVRRLGQAVAASR